MMITEARGAGETIIESQFSRFTTIARGAGGTAIENGLYL